ncbi:folate-binding protein YgfZ [Nereida sp. MMG025]|uniref:CAF17-like 4Fe-4S cluster assembly/insertion protein YgfZ n=1 Tax=Nereida sp. MMG025 TaxID=2909981 RepID=UPI001F40B7C0|nr:folate-binding protein [Nereida sp. MMG025]MCF6445073.1 folate-binding protein [Nereida sp. MMG025]
MTNRTVIALTGADKHSLLDGLITNQFTPDSPLTYAALLTPQGKYVADFFLSNQGDEILIDVAESHAAVLAQRLGMYKLRADVQIAESPLHVHLGQGGDADPRHPALPARSYLEQPQDAKPDLTALRVENMIPETGQELTNDSYILELGFERLNGVDFKKGCFVGQEIVARMKHKTELKKGLVQVAHDGSAAPDTPITNNGKPAGHLHTVHGDKGLAYLRFDRADGMDADGVALTLIQKGI